MKELIELPKAEKKVMAKVLVEDYSTRQIEEWLGEDNVSISRWAKQQTPDSLKQFETDFRMSIMAMKSKGVAMVHKRLVELIPKERRISEVVKAGEFLEGRSQQNIQNNNTFVVKVEDY